MLKSILTAYGLPAEQCDILPFGTGLINNTWKVNHGKDEYILQRINENVFKQPADIAENIRNIGEYLAVHAPEYLFVLPVSTVLGEELVHDETGYYRLMPFIRNSRTYVVASSPEIAREAAREFGCFTRMLSGFDASRLKITLPDFHNLTLRYRQFEESLETGNRERISEASVEIQIVRNNKQIVAVFERIAKDPTFKKRVTHHDTKISNVLFDDKNHGLCVIDLDTTMAGYFISDVGDMMRTYLCPLSEEEKALADIQVRDEYFTAIANGYLEEMLDELSPAEIGHFVYSGEYMIYMQAVRFLTDYFNNDVYYGAKYEGHNLLRARNQLALLQCYQEKNEQYDDAVAKIAAAHTKQIR